MANTKSFNRRDFIRTLVGASATGALGSMGQLTLMREAAAAAPTFTDYKAMVCIFLYGGNDSFNMFIPNGADNKKGYSNYQSIRGNLAVANNALNENSINDYHVDGTHESAYLKGLYSLASEGIDLGINGVMPEVAQLVKAKKASIIGNVGNLVSPVTRSQVQADTANLPLFLFAHNHQQRALQTGQGNNLNDVGWAGRIADNWAGINSASPAGLNISYAGNDRMMIGKDTVPLAIRPGSPPKYMGMRKNHNTQETERRALFKALAGMENSSPTLSFNNTSTFTTNDPFKSFYGSAKRKSLDVFDLLSTAWDNHTVSYARKDIYGGDLFSVPDKSTTGFGDEIGGGLISELEAVAKMIDIGAKNAFSAGAEHNRQIFMIKLGGFDTHSAQASKHPLLLRQLSLALGKFQNAMEELGHANKVTTFTMSDFGRSLSNNGDGTDHAWGAHHIVMGGDGSLGAGNLNGGKMLGTLPDLTLDGDDDFNAQGRIIPSLAQDQLNASICRWFGVDNTLMPTIFPNLTNFALTSGADANGYLNNLFV